MYQAYLYVWKYIGEEWAYIVKVPIFESPTSEWPWVHLDVGELRSGYPGEEIVLAVTKEYTPDQLILYPLEGGTLSVIKTLDYYRVQINNVYIANSDDDVNNEIVVSGYGRSDRNSGRFYLEVFDENGDREWYRL